MQLTRSWGFTLEKVDVTDVLDFRIPAATNDSRKSGRKTEAREILSELLARSKKSYVPPCNIAMVYTGLGEKSGSTTWIRWLKSRSTIVVRCAYNERGHPLVIAMLKRQGEARG